MPRKKKSVHVVSSPIKASNRPSKLIRNWRNEAMTGAIEAVKGEVGVNRAAKEFGVATTALRDRLSGRGTHGTKSGPKPHLSFQKEGELTEYLASTSKAGYEKTASHAACSKGEGVSAKGIVTLYCLTWCLTIAIRHTRLIWCFGITTLCSLTWYLSIATHHTL